MDCDSNKDHKLESTKVEMGDARGENEILKPSLEVKDYQTMHKHMNFSNNTQQDEQEEVNKVACTMTNVEESELVSLSLGMSYSKGQTIMDEKKNIKRNKMIKEDESFDEGLALGLNTTFDPSIFGEGKKEELNGKWTPSKVLKTTRTSDISETSQHTPFKKTRVCIRARCDTQTMNDGCQWRKYGQKMAKGNPCPRAYYRCTASASCPVRKQVQRCVEDMSILITTYEGTHNHSLPTSATTIAYTTSAAASMFNCSSLTSKQGLGGANMFPIINSNISYNLNSLNYTSTNPKLSRPQQPYFQNSPISSSNTHPTITLDLTAPQSQSPIGKFTPSLSSTPQQHSSINPNLSSINSPLQASMLQSTWSPYSGHINYEGSITQNRYLYGSLMNNGKHPFNGYVNQPNSIMATTKEITTNPKFQSALAAALSTYVGHNGASSDRVKEGNVSTSNASNAQTGNMFKFPPSE